MQMNSSHTPPSLPQFLILLDGRILDVYGSAFDHSPSSQTLMVESFSGISGDAHHNRTMDASVVRLRESNIIYTIRFLCFVGLPPLILKNVLCLVFHSFYIYNNFSTNYCSSWRWAFMSTECMLNPLSRLELSYPNIFFCMGLQVPAA